MKPHLVGIGEYRVANGSGEAIPTLALGSCVAVLFHDAVTGTAALIHVALPEFKVNAEKAERTPGYFVDTGMPAVMAAIAAAGAAPKRLRIKLVGGASMMDQCRTFDIGRRNVLAIKRYLWKNGLGVIKEECCHIVGAEEMVAVSGKKTDRTEEINLAYNDILIVDDSGTSPMIIRRCLEIAGFAESIFHEAADGLAALSFLKETMVDLVITDLKMPKMDGTTLVHKLKNDARTREIPILVVSSMGNDTIESDLRAAGASWIVHKPVSPEALSEVLQ